MLGLVHDQAVCSEEIRLATRGDCNRDGNGNGRWERTCRSATVRGCCLAVVQKCSNNSSEECGSVDTHPGSYAAKCWEAFARPDRVAEGLGLFLINLPSSQTRKRGSSILMHSHVRPSALRNDRPMIRNHDTTCPFNGTHPEESPAPRGEFQGGIGVSAHQATQAFKTKYC